MLETELENKIIDFEIYIKSRHEDLKIQAIWLFVATLGCWSVNQIATQIIALFIVFFLFFSKLSKNKKGDESFPERISNIKKEINDSCFDIKLKKAMLYDIGNLESDWLGRGSSFKKMPEFMVVYFFWSWSLVVFLSRLFFPEYGL